MRKNLFISALMLLLPMLACALTPSELAGNWSSETIELANEGGQSMSVIPNYTINADGTFTDASTMVFKESQMGVSIQYKIRSKVSGTYAINGDDVTLTYDYANGSFTCAKEDIEISGDMPEQQKKQGIETMAQMMSAMVIPQLKQEAMSDPKETWDNVKATSTTLSYSVDGRDVTLYKK